MKEFSFALYFISEHNRCNLDSLSDGNVKGRSPDISDHIKVIDRHTPENY